ncbi:MAG: lipoyl(octanoyl) transferase LipB [Candidatus Gastranaerophilales bacterium]|nr:lipoyl(octanoyl) transferase LipB [Candidatus Gastranaerophilales bacterium]
MNKFKVEKLGLMQYLLALDYQNRLVERKQQGDRTNYLLLLEHYPVFTASKGADERNILDTRISVITTNRGGDITCHMPGQLIGYLIIDLKAANISVHTHLRSIESLIIKVLSKVDVSAYTIPSVTGVWARGKKVASIGVGVRRGITMHGFALNVNPDLSYFSRINPCGQPSDMMSSLEKLENKRFELNFIQNLFEEEIYGYL